MSALWSGLAPRERRLVLLAVPLLAAMAAWALVWEPFMAEHHRLRETLPAKQATAQWMEAAARAIERRGSGPATGRADTGESLLSLVDRSSKDSGIASTIKRIQPDGSDQVRLWLEDVPFDSLAGWLVALKRDAGVVATELRADRQERDGVVDARITFARGGGAA